MSRINKKKILVKSHNIKGKKHLSFQRKVYMKAQDSATLTGKRQFLSNAEEKLF